MATMLRMLRKTPQDIDVDPNDYLLFKETNRHGFPPAASCLDYNEELSLLAIGTKEKRVEVYGAADYSWSAMVSGRSGVAQVFWVAGAPRLFALCQDGSFHRFDIVDDRLEETGVAFEIRLKRITSCAVLPSSSTSVSTVAVPQRPPLLLIGTVAGNVHSLNTDTLEFDEFLLYDELIHNGVPGEERPENAAAAVLPPSAAEEDRAVLQCALRPHHSKQMLLRFGAHTLVLYDAAVNEIECRVRVQVPVMHVCWTPAGDSWYAGHADGSTSLWSVDTAVDGPRESPSQLFGPFPCSPVSRVGWANTELGIVRIMSGGMPRPSYADRHTLTLQRNDRLSTLDFQSAVIDFRTVLRQWSATDNVTKGGPLGIAVLVLCEQELVVVDLADAEWRTLPLEHLHPLHASTITSIAHTVGVDETVWRRLQTVASTAPPVNGCSHQGWPLVGTGSGASSASTTTSATGGTLLPVGSASAATTTTAKRQSPSPTSALQTQSPLPPLERRNLLVTGHENGNLMVWWSSGRARSLKLLLTVKTSREFGAQADNDDVQSTSSGNESNAASDDEDLKRKQRQSALSAGDWPPFQPAGEWDPFCDEPQLAITKISICPSTGQLVVGARGGHVLIYDLADTALTSVAPQLVKVELLESSKTPAAVRQSQALEVRTARVKFAAGYQPKSTVFQLSPAVGVAALTALSSSGLVAVANDFGFAVLDVQTNGGGGVLHKLCTVSDQRVAELSALDGALGRFKTMKKSLRQTFRRKKKPTHEERTQPNGAVAHHEDDGDEDEERTKPVERRIESRALLSSTVVQGVAAGGEAAATTTAVRTLVFLNGPALLGTASSEAVLAVGTNAGLLQHYVLERPPPLAADSSDRAASSSTSGPPSPDARLVCRLQRELRLAHAAPIVHVQLVTSVPSSSAGHTGTAASTGTVSRRWRTTSSTSTTEHQLLTVVSEEQVRSYALPSMRLMPKLKYKLTAIEGVRAKKAQLVTLRSRQDRAHVEPFLALLSNQGEIYAAWLGNAKRRTKVQALKATDVVGIGSSLLTASAELWSLKPGGTQLQRASLNHLVAK